MAKLKLFQYAIILHPTEDQNTKGVNSTLLGDGIKTILVNNTEDVKIVAGREIEDKYMHQLSQIEIIVRPF